MYHISLHGFHINGQFIKGNNNTDSHKKILQVPGTQVLFEVYLIPGWSLVEGWILIIKKKIVGNSGRGIVLGTGWGTDITWTRYLGGQSTNWPSLVSLSFFMYGTQYHTGIHIVWCFIIIKFWVSLILFITVKVRSEKQRVKTYDRKG